MMNLSDFIHTNIKKELLDLGHSSAIATSAIATSAIATSAIATSCADSARAKYNGGSNWKMGTVYAELSKEAKKVAGKVKKVKK